MCSKLIIMNFDMFLGCIKGIADFLVQMQWSLFGLIVLIVIKKPLQGVISHPFSFDIGGKKFKFNEQPDQTVFKDSSIAKESDDSLSKSLKDLKNHESKTSKLYEAEIRGAHEDYKTTDDTKVVFLIKLLGLARAKFEFANIYIWIYGSQVELLRYLFSHSQALEPLLKFYYNQASKSFPNLYKNYSFDNWIAFLISIKLVQKDNDSYSITEKGKEFVEYVNEQKFGQKLY